MQFIKGNVEAIPDNFNPTLYAAETSKTLLHNIYAALHFILKNLLFGMFDMKLWHFKKTLNHFNSELEISEETPADAFFYDDDVRNSGSVSIRTLTSV